MRRRSPGFTLIEAMVSIGIAGAILMVVASLYAFAARSQATQLPTLPFVIARSTLANVVRNRVLSADCITLPAGGAAGDTLAGRSGLTCANEPTGGAVSHFAICLHAASKRVLYKKSIAPVTEDCGVGGAPGGWIGLTPAMLEATAIESAFFRRSAVERNRVTARLLLAWRTADARTTASQTWEATMASPGALRPD
ncbi:MAG: prepilin-type N-terminal cleavage/methylation domain-containing protein [Elusimicrobia bacterium]|nr:prepilin-type N-terminal cleavage/methylation domain-containing protein [Elusimicrobiota bacterium]